MRPPQGTGGAQPWPFGVGREGDAQGESGFEAGGRTGERAPTCGDGSEAQGEAIDEEVEEGRTCLLVLEESGKEQRSELDPQGSRRCTSGCGLGMQDPGCVDPCRLQVAHGHVCNEWWTIVVDAGASVELQRDVSMNSSVGAIRVRCDGPSRGEGENEQSDG